MIQTLVKSLYPYVPWRILNVADWVRQMVLAVRDYLSRDEDNGSDRRPGCVEEVDEDNARGSLGASSGPLNTDHENVTASGELVADGQRPIVNIHLPSNTGTVIIGDNPTVSCVDNSKGKNPGTAKSGNSRSLNNANSPETEVPVRVHRRRNKSASERGNTPPKVPSIVRRIDEIDKSLSKLRENGEWKTHEETIKKLIKEYHRDEDNSDVILLLRYEEAAAIYEKNDHERCMTLVRHIAREINVSQTNWDGVNDMQKLIYCKCLFLTSRIRCVETKFGKAEKALNLASSLLCKYKNVELESFYHLENAYYKFCLNQCTESRVNSVIEDTNKAERTSSALIGNVYKENWEKIRREILLLRCQAIIQFNLANADSVLPQKLSDTLTGSMAELEGQLWNGISPKQKIAFHKLKSIHFEIEENSAQTMEHAEKALEIAKGCQFSNEVSLLTDRIRQLQKYPKEPVNDSERVVSRVLGIVSATDGNLESNAAECTERGIFSTDESDFDFADTNLLRQDRYLLYN